MSPIDVTPAACGAFSFFFPNADCLLPGSCGRVVSLPHGATRSCDWPHDVLPLVPVKALRQSIICLSLTSRVAGPGFGWQTQTHCRDELWDL